MLVSPIITFTSDFGLRDQYVGAVKGAILTACPNATIIDITHDVGSHDLLEAAFIVASAYKTFPTRTVHLVVVDPTVGSARRPIVVCIEGAYFVAPDNGVLSLIYSREQVRVISVEAGHYFRKPVSPTFQARDLFGPVAGWLAGGTDPDKFGPEITDYARFALPALQKTGANRVDGIVLHIDRFGNVITSISPEELHRLAGPDARPSLFRVNGKEIRSQRSYYAESNEDELFSLVGSAGYFEIAALKKSAARLLDVRRGNKVELELQ